MTPFYNGILLDNTNQYGVLKTETVFRLTSAHENFENDINSTDPLDWIYSDNKFGTGALKDRGLSRSLKEISIPPQFSDRRSRRVTKELGKTHKKKKGKKKCIYQLFKGNESKHKKYLLLILGLMAAKSVLVTIALKALAFISAKGLMMGFFSTILASLLSLKGMFDHSNAWNRREDAKTQVEIIQVPSKSNEHHYDYYKRGDRIPLKLV